MRQSRMKENLLANGGAKERDGPIVLPGEFVKHAGGPRAHMTGNNHALHDMRLHVLSDDHRFDLSKRLPVTRSCAPAATPQQLPQPRIRV